MSKRESAIAHDRTEKALASAARWLKRRGARREKRETRQAYNDAASLIVNRLRRA